MVLHKVVVCSEPRWTNERDVGHLGYSLEYLLNKEYIILLKTMFRSVAESIKQINLGKTHIKKVFFFNWSDH